MNFKHPEMSSTLNTNNVFRSGAYRITLLTSRILRIEHDPSQTFVNAPSLRVIHRFTENVPHTLTFEGQDAVLHTQHLKIEVASHAPLYVGSLRITVKENNRVWRYGETERENLKGTARTLDQVNGELKLNDGYLSKDGFVVVDDSKTMLFTEDGWIQEREVEEVDLLFIAAGNDYKGIHSDLVKFMGHVPKFPRYVLGNWWSKYWNYSDQELLETVDRFSSMHIPLSVCIVDMDWHLTEIPTKDYWYGWTGYTVNPEYFPDLEGFIAQLHRRNIKTSLNLHPALGVRPHEGKYEEFAKRMGIDPLSQEVIPFRIEDKDFTQAYFEVLHHPFEKQGVDFWWIDWQQGTKTSLEGIDPLWMLNHYHALDSGRDRRKRPFTFSRWTQLGGHRYPIGFSGDTVSTWKSLAFQPYFTATAANVNFSWWSHDIGGHYKGLEEPELFMRWVQFGCFSPILRLHSSKNEMAIREPWNFSQPYRDSIVQAMQLRTSLLPYLYTGLHRNSIEGTPFLVPSYYEYPNDPLAYAAQDQYFFGENLLVAPVITPIVHETGRAYTKVYLPEGEWIHWYSGKILSGNHTITELSDVSEVPVYAKAGSILPLVNLEKEKDATQNPSSLLIRIFMGKPCGFVMVEDDNESQDYLHGDVFKTRFILQEDRFIIEPDQQAKDYIPTKREYILEFVGYEVKGEFESIQRNVSTFITLPYDFSTSKREVLIRESLPMDQTKLVRDQLKRLLTACKAQISIKGEILRAFDRNPSSLDDVLVKHRKQKRLVQAVKHLIDQT